MRHFSKCKVVQIKALRPNSVDLEKEVSKSTELAAEFCFFSMLSALG
jgi:hypothetical protein